MFTTPIWYDLRLHLHPGSSLNADSGCISKNVLSNSSYRNALDMQEDSWSNDNDYDFLTGPDEVPVRLSTVSVTHEY